MNKVLVFDIWSDWGFFRKIEATSSPQSYSFPPRTTITGIIAAFLGYDRDSYYEKFSPEKCNVALRIMNPVIKCKHNTNLIDTKKIDKHFLFSGRTQVPFDYLKNPKYKIYFTHEDLDIYSKLKKHLTEHTSVYTITLGLAGNLANYEFIGEFELYKLQNNKTEILSVIKLDLIKEFNDFSNDYESLGKTAKEIMKENMPRYFQNKERECAEYCEYVFERKTKPILIEIKENADIYFIKNQDNKEHLIFL